MAARNAPATVVVCAPLSLRIDAPRPAATVPVTWVADLDSLVDVGPGVDASGLALAIDPAWLRSRQALRMALVRARHAVPGLEAAVLRGGPLAHHSVLAEEGIRVVAVDAFAEVGRGSRRPAPAGWPCRNVAWGLWEVRGCPPRRSRAWAWLPGMPAPRRDALYVAPAADATSSLRRLVDWTGRGVAAGRTVAVTLADLPAILEGRRAPQLAASVLKAA